MKPVKREIEDLSHEIKSSENRQLHIVNHSFTVSSRLYASLFLLNGGALVLIPNYLSNMMKYTKRMEVVALSENLRNSLLTFAHSISLTLISLMCVFFSIYFAGYAERHYGVGYYNYREQKRMEHDRDNTDTETEEGLEHASNLQVGIFTTNTAAQSSFFHGNALIYLIRPLEAFAILFGLCALYLFVEGIYKAIDINNSLMLAINTLG